MWQNKTPIIIIILSFFIGIYFYPQMPDKMASHWNIKNEVDGYLPKFWGLFLMPLVSLGMYGLFIALPRIDPLRNNIEKFKKYYFGFIFTMVIFLFYIYILTIVANLGHEFDIGMFLIPGLSLLFFYIGVMLKNSKRNWFVGIRTPWTMQNDKVWKKTHKLGSILFKISSVLILVGIFLPEYVFWIVIGSAIIISIVPIVYSYIIFKKSES